MSMSRSVLTFGAATSNSHHIAMLMTQIHNALIIQSGSIPAMQCNAMQCNAMQETETETGTETETETETATATETQKMEMEME
jgi:hypothetical protein